MSGVEEGQGRGPGCAPAAGAEARNARWRRGAAAATAAVRIRPRLCILSRKILPKVQDVIITNPFVCQIRAQRHIEVRALERGYINNILIKEGQAVKQGDSMFKLLPTLDQAEAK